jgi:polysaccharide deacetylase family protein (PEP-CTERM system associated)
MNRSTDAASSASPSGSHLQPGSPAPQVSRSRAGLRNHVLTIGLEDYYHAAAFRHWIRQETWYRFENRLGKTTRRALDLLDRCGARATFFVDRHTARFAPDLVREVAGRGHEIASRGDHADTPRELGAARFREHAVRCRDEVEQVVGRRVLGFRLAGDRLTPEELWVLDVLAECGYLYDSSIGPALGTNATKVLRCYHRYKPRLSHRLFHEVPISSLAVFGLEVPIADGGSLRHLPTTWMRNVVEHWDRHRSEPYVMYFRTWELDPEQPRINAGPMAARMWHYRNLDRMAVLLEQFLTPYRFTTVAEHLGLEYASQHSSVETVGSALHAVVRRSGEVAQAAVRRSGSAGPTPVTVVVPCFNESQSLRYLNNTLQSLTKTFGEEYAFTFVFVDDGSTDDTWATLNTLFGGREDCRLVRHEQNHGAARSIQTGLRHAETQVVCSIDCDCTYDPHELARMIPLLTDDVDVVTASPYHPQGKVRNVPGWRLFLSRHLSRLYRLVLRQKLFTYTSCFRVYRKQTTAALEIRHPGFLGVAEFIAQADLAGRRIVEYPTTLEVRVLGHSKMKVLQTIAGHLSLLTNLARLRLTRRSWSMGVEAGS